MIKVRLDACPSLRSRLICVSLQPHTFLSERNCRLTPTHADVVGMFTRANQAILLDMEAEIQKFPFAAPPGGGGFRGQAQSFTASGDEFLNLLQRVEITPANAHVLIRCVRMHIRYMHCVPFCCGMRWSLAALSFTLSLYLSFSQ